MVPAVTGVGLVGGGGLRGEAREDGGYGNVDLRGIPGVAGEEGLVRRFGLTDE